MNEIQWSKIAQCTETPVRVTLADGDKYLQITTFYRLASHVVILGRTSAVFNFHAEAKGGSRTLAQQAYFQKTDFGSDDPLHELFAYAFAIVLDCNAQSSFLMSFQWGNQALQYRAGAEKPFPNLAPTIELLPPALLWNILRRLIHLSQDWHELLYLIPKEIMLKSERSILDFREQEIFDRLSEILPDLDATGWLIFMDNFDMQNLSGWVKRLDSDQSQPFDLYLNGKLVRSNIDSSGFRRDVLEAGFGSGRYGFVEPVPRADKESGILAFTIQERGGARILGYRLWEQTMDAPPVRCIIEQAVPVIRGWCIIETDKDRVFEFDVYIDDVFYGTARNDRLREDLKKKGIVDDIGGFMLESPAKFLTPGSHKVRLDFWGGRESQEYKFNNPGRLPAPLGSLDFLEKPVSIVIPFYNDPCLYECLDCVFKYTPEHVEIILVDDCSPDVHAEDILAKFNPPHTVRLLRNEKNLKFSGTVNRGITEAGTNDVILLNQDARVTPGWYRSIIVAANRYPGIGTVTPLSDRAGAFSAPAIGNNNPLPILCSEAEFATAIRRASFHLEPTTPTGHGFCLYINRACLEEVGLIDEKTFAELYGDENDFCMRAMRAGWRHVVADDAYVFHERQASFLPGRAEQMQKNNRVVEAMYPEYRAIVSRFNRSRAMRYVRFSATLASRNWRELSRPRILYTMAVKNGGTPQTNLDLMRKFQEIADVFLLVSDTRKLFLYKLDDGELVQWYEYELKDQMEPISHVSPEYDAVVAGWLYELDIDIVHIRQIIWHSLNLIPIAKKLGCKVIYSVHDFYPVSSNLNLIDDTGVFRGADYHAYGSSYRATIWHRSISSKLPVHDANFRRIWKRRFAKYLGQCDALVTTSEATRSIVIEELPELENVRWQVIPHGRDFPGFRNFAHNLEPWQPVRLLVPGNIGAQKGSGFIEALAEYDRQNYDRFEFHVLGRWDGNHDSKIIEHGEFNRDEFYDQLLPIRPNASLILSIWSETWCHTLTESWAAGLPCFIFDFGTQSQRMKECGAGWILESDNIPDLYRELLEKLEDPESVAGAMAGVRKWQATTGLVQNTKMMAANYYDLYAGLLNRRKPSRRIALCTKAGLGSSHVRVLEPARNDFGRDNTYIVCNGEELLAYARAGMIDAALIQRNLLAKQLVDPTLRELARQKIPYIYEMDDDLLNIPADKDHTQWYRNYARQVTAMIENSAGVTVSTPELATRYGEKYTHTRLLETRLSRDLFNMQPASRMDDNMVRAFYHGTSTHKEDLLAILPALRAVANKYPYFRLSLWGIGLDMEDILRDNAFIEVNPMTSGFISYPKFARLLHALTRDLDFGIAPLIDNKFNRAKSYLKVLEYGAIGLPAIASNCVPYSELKDFPHLDLANNDIASWTAALERKILRGKLNRRDGLECQERIATAFAWTPEARAKFDRQINAMYDSNVTAQ